MKTFLKYLNEDNEEAYEVYILTAEFPQMLLNYTRDHIRHIVPTVPSPGKGIFDFFYNQRKDLYQKLQNYLIQKGIKKIYIDWRQDVSDAVSDEADNTTLAKLEDEYEDLFSSNVEKMVKEFMFSKNKEIIKFLIQTQDDIFIDIMIFKPFGLDDDLKLLWLEKNPENIFRIPNPSRKIMEHMVDRCPWKLTDQIVQNWPEDLKSQWQRVGKARKQIGL